MNADDSVTERWLVGFFNEFNRDIRKLGNNFQSERSCKFVFLQADRRTDIKNSNLNRSIEWNYSFISLGDDNVRITSVLLHVVYRLKYLV